MRWSGVECETGERATAEKGVCVGGWLVRKVCGGFDGWIVLVTSRKQPKAAFAPFLKFFTIFDAPPTDCAVRMKGHVSDRGKGQFFPPAAAPRLRVRYLFLRNWECTVTEQPGVPPVYSIDVCQTVFGFYYFLAYRTGADLQPEKFKQRCVARNRHAATIASTLPISLPPSTSLFREMEIVSRFDYAASFRRRVLLTPERV